MSWLMLPERQQPSHQKWQLSLPAVSETRKGESETHGVVSREGADGGGGAREDGRDEEMATATSMVTKVTKNGNMPNWQFQNADGGFRNAQRRFHFDTRNRKSSSRSAREVSS